MFIRSYVIIQNTQYLPVKEVFVERKFREGDKPGQIVRLDTTSSNANLIIILSEQPKIGVLGVDWELLLADGVSLKDVKELTYCSRPGLLTLRFELKNYQPSVNPDFLLRLQFMKGSATNVVNIVELKATPL